jgi:hypothetical protein
MDSGPRAQPAYKHKGPDFRPALVVTRFIRLHRGAQKGSAANLEGRCSHRTASKTSMPTLNEQRNPQRLRCIRCLSQVFVQIIFFRSKRSGAFLLMDNVFCRIVRLIGRFTNKEQRVRNSYDRALSTAPSRIINCVVQCDCRQAFLSFVAEKPRQYSRWHAACLGWSRTLHLGPDIRWSSIVAPRRILSGRFQPGRAVRHTGRREQFLQGAERVQRY